MKTTRYYNIILLIFISVSALGQNTDDLYKNLTFRNLGPNRGGRSTAITGNIHNSSEFYMGTTGGGLWKTNNRGISWENISDGFFKTGSIGAVRVSATNDSILYCGTGSDGIRSNIILGEGVYRSTDKGKNWIHIGLSEAGQIGAVEIHPNNPNTLYVAAIGNPFRKNEQRGIFRSYNGGENWEKVLYLSDSIGFSDIEFAPDNPNILYATAWKTVRKPWTIISGGYQEGGVYKSIDGGDSWKKITNGLPTGLIGKGDLAVSKDKPEYVYALIEAPQGEGGLFLSKDYGEKFELISTKKQLLDRPFYYCNVDVNPQNAKTVYVSSTQFWVSYDEGKKWKRVRTPHGDNHDLWIHPKDTMIVAQSNDGGGNISSDGMKNWSTQRNQPTAELYQVETDDQTPYWLYAGQQDNSTLSLPSRPPFRNPSGEQGFWRSVGGCETGPSVPKPGNPDIVYSNCKGRFSVYNKKTGKEKNYYVGGAYLYGHNPKDLKFRFQRVAPIHVSPHNPDIVYHGSQYLHKTINDGVSWNIISPDLTAFEPDKQMVSGSPITRDVTGEEYYSTLYSIRESPIEKGQIWTGANDGPLHVTNDGGMNWKNVTPKELPKGGRIDSVEPSPHNKNKSFFTSTRHLLGDNTPYIYITTDKGSTWSLITSGIPATCPVRVVREDPKKEGLLFAGTDCGLYVSHTNGKRWENFQSNLPVSQITDIKIKNNDLVLSTMGRGFWILDNIMAIREGFGERNDNYIFPFTENHVILQHYANNGIPKYPENGIAIDYYLAKEDSSEIRIEIRDSKGKLIRLFNKKKIQKVDTIEEMSQNINEIIPENKLSNDKGFNRLIWNYRHYSPQKPKEKSSYPYGPLVTAGLYKVSLLTKNDTITRAFTLEYQESVTESPEDIIEQEQFQIQVRELLEKSWIFENELKEEIKDLNNQKKKKITKKNMARLTSLKSILSQLETAEGRYQLPGLSSQIQYLYNINNSTYQVVGGDSRERFEILLEQFSALRTQYKEL